MSLFTEEIYEKPVFPDFKQMAVLSGKDCFGESINSVPLKDCHTLVLGATGMGKTCQIRNMLKQTVQQKNNIHIIFDPGLTYYKEFYRKGEDYVLSLFDLPDVERKVRWNMMRDISADNHPETAVREVVNTLCKEAIDHSAEKFFPQAAETAITAIWIMTYRRYKHELPNNRTLIQKTKSMSYAELLNEASRPENADLRPDIEKFLNPTGGITTYGIEGEMHSILTQAFNPNGNFCSDGTFSARQFIRNGQGKRLFLAYDLATAASSGQIFGILLNLMMKDSLSPQNTNPNHRIYYYLDEVPLLPDNISNLNKLLNFGRKFGNRVIFGLQSLSQLYDTYGEHAGNTMLSAFNNNIIMKLNDPVSIENIVARSGKAFRETSVMELTRNEIINREDQTYKIPPEVMANLSVGQAVISIEDVPPFFIHLDQ